MKKRFLPFSLLLVIMILGQAVMADGGHYVPRAKETTSVEAFMSSMRVNQHTGLIDPAWMIAASKQSVTNTREELPDALYWISMGPDNLGGRTTSIVYNNQNQSEVYIGSMGGGVFVSQGVTWRRIGETLMVSCMAQAEDGTIYVGTGDGSGAQNYNGMADLGYTNGFVGTGIYTIKAGTMSTEPMEGTAPSTLNGIAEWSFVNDLAVDGNTLIAATSDGIRYCALNGGEWSYAQVDGEDLTGEGLEVIVAADHKVLASVDGVLYIGTLDDMERYSGEDGEVLDADGNIVKIAPSSANVLDIAIAPSDKKVIYAAIMNSDGNHENIYCSNDFGATWTVALPAVTSSLGHNVYGGRGLFNHGMVVNPNDAGCVYVLGKDIWSLKQYAQTGAYVAVNMSSDYQVHGINALLFDPKDEQGKTGYVATDGGIYKSSISTDGNYYLFEDCNRGYYSTRCLNVTPTHDAKRVLAGVLDHGPVLIKGIDNVNSLETSELLLPNYTPVSSAYYSEYYLSGSSAASVINPEVFFITSQENSDIRIKRTEHECIDWDENNFTGQEDLLGEKIAYSGLRMPFALYETFEDPNPVNGVWYKFKKDMNEGETIQCFSNNAGYPFDYTLTSDVDAGDSLLVPDPVTAKLYVPNEVTDEGTQILVTFDGLRFNKVAEWHLLTTVTDSLGAVTCFTVSADGDVLFIGTQAGGLVRISNLNAVVDSLTVTTEAEVLEMNLCDQCITSISVYNEDNNKVVVTLGNYGNECNILYSGNAMDTDPVFVAKQGTGLPQMPIYSSVYTVYRHTDAEGNVEEAEHVLIGTEHGVYRTTDITASSPEWVAEKAMMGDVPVMEMRQQNMTHPDQEVVTMVDDAPVVTVYPGVRNQGMIYAATFGAGLFRCENYRVQYSGEGVSETPAIAETNVTMYPNPVREAARLSFELNDKASVSYQVYDIAGRMVKAERLGDYGQGKHEVEITVNGLTTGAYVLRLNAGNQTSNVKFMVF